MSGTTPPPGSDPGEDQNPYAQPGQPQQPQDQPWASAPPPSGGPPAWSGASEESQAAWESPAGDALGQERPEPPKSIRTAVKLMYVGAGISALYALIFLVAGDSIRDNMRSSFGDTSDMSQSDIDSLVDGAFAFTVGLFVVAILLWLWMASVNKKGRGWGRILSTVLGALYMIYSLLTLAGGGLNMILGLVSLVLAAYILYLLYRRESSEYYTAVSRTRG